MDTNCCLTADQCKGFAFAPVPTQPLSKSFTNTARSFVESSKKVAKDILSSNEDSDRNIGRVQYHDHYHHHYYDYGYSPYWGRPARGYSRRDDDDVGFRFAIGFLASMVGLVAFYALGVNLGRVKEANEELSETHSFQRVVYTNKAVDRDRTDFLYQLENIASIRENIFRRIRNNAMWDLAATISIASACVLGVGGAFTASYAAMTAGTIVGLSAGAVMLFKWGFDSTEKQHYRDAKDMLKVIEELPKY